MPKEKKKKKEKEEEEEEKAELMGKRETEEVKRLLKEWMEIDSNPIEEDIKQVEKYFERLAKENLEQVWILLQFLLKKSKSKDKAWIDSVSLIVSKVNQTVSKLYGNPLKFSH